MDEIIRFVMLAQSARFTVRELCEQFGIHPLHDDDVFREAQLI
jgi:hypothetical protein